MGARDTALSALIACRRQQAWSDGVLKEYIARDRLGRQDAALATRLCYGVLQNRMLLDWWISAFLRGKPGDLQPVVLDILRLGVYQLQLMDKIPASAAVNEGVSQAKRLANPRAAGLVNGVLRNMTRSPERLNLPEDLPTRYSHPAGLVSLLEKNVGAAKIEPLLRCHNAAPATCVQVNTLLCTTKQAAQLLTEEGIRCQAHPWMQDCLTIQGGSLEGMRAYRSGLIYVQDPAAKLAALCAGVKPGMQVLDCCGAPGGKSFAAAIAMENQGRIITCDLHAHKIALINKGAERLKISCIIGMQNDASNYREDWRGAFDAVIADVPCSGLGVIRKKPDIRYKSLEELEKLPEIQTRIIDNQANYVKPGGVLLYSTCTVLKRENEQIIADFLKKHPEFAPERLDLPAHFGVESSQITLLPCDHGTDGFFICKLRRKH